MTKYNTLTMMRTLAVLSLAVITFGCESSGDTETPQDSVRAPTSTCTDMRPSDTCEVESRFMGMLWENIHAGQYDNIPGAIDEIKSHLEENPDDVEANKSIGFLRTWQLGELYRSDTPDLSQILTGLEESTFHFGKVLEQDNDPRIIIFKSSNEYVAAKQFGDTVAEAETRAQFLSAVEAWPELNYFVGGTMLSMFTQPADDDFQRAVEYMWGSVDLCAGEIVDRQNPLPQMQAKIRDVRREGDARACSNSWLAPHSFEGFWMFFGDLLTKAGELEVARIMYEYAKTAADYESWKFKDVLDARIANIETNMGNFRLPSAEQDPKYHPVAEWSCTVCHQRE